MIPSSFSPRRDFSSLAVRDLLEARDVYHVHLAHLENVVGTAIGRFRIRRDDSDAERSEPVEAGLKKSFQNDTPRTLEGSVVRPWSWPCVLVFVRHWMPPEQFRAAPDQAVPRFLYLADGRVVPTCVLLAEPRDVRPAPVFNLLFPQSTLGGGYPVISDAQGETRVGSLGCLVSDGSSLFALTNRHILGEPGTAMRSVLASEDEESAIGVADARQVGKIAFSEAWPGWPGTRAFANIDAGLIRIGHAADWTAQVFGVGEVDALIDLNVDTMSLDLIGCPVRAFGAASGELRGEIQALFYRYKTVGGFDYIADLLIGSRAGDAPLQTRHGDSGTVWFYDHELPTEAARKAGLSGTRARRFRPLALQWGGHRLAGAEAETELQFALATCLSSACRLLDVEVVRDVHVGLSEFWGQVGHYKIGYLACDLVSTAKLRTFLQLNADRIGISDAGIEGNAIGAINHNAFVPLANVPDDEWKKPGARPRDNPSHYVNLDLEGAGEFAGQTFWDFFADPANLDAAAWDRFYEALGTQDKYKGFLPLRVWQIYQAMVSALRDRDVTRFLCAAGILAHYVGDSCQPLHASVLHDGATTEDEGVHSAYETRMLDRFRTELIAGLATAVAGQSAQPQITGGRAAARSLLDLMQQTLGTLPPMDIIEVYRDYTGQQRTREMWEALGDRTITCMASGCLHLAMLWESAWEEGGGDQIADGDLIAIDRDLLMSLYTDQSFIRSYYLPELAQQSVLT